MRIAGLRLQDAEYAKLKPWQESKILTTEGERSAEFAQAFEALKQGATIRRASWEFWTCLRMNGDHINVFRMDKCVAPDWRPMSADLQATDWLIA